jgi:hypothetical protein
MPCAFAAVVSDTKALPTQSKAIRSNERDIREGILSDANSTPLIVVF